MHLWKARFKMFIKGTTGKSITGGIMYVLFQYRYMQIRILSEYLIHANKKHCYITQSPIQEQNANAVSKSLNKNNFRKQLALTLLFFSVRFTRK